MTDLDKVLELLNNLTIKQEQLAQEARLLILISFLSNMTNLLTPRAQLKNHTCSCGAQYHYDPTAHHSPPTSPSAGGVDTFRASRGSISSLSGLLGTSPISTSGFSPTLNDVTNGNDTSNRSSTPYGNLSLDAAVRGAGAPGGLVPPEKDAKKKHKGFYPSRVVLTSESTSYRISLCCVVDSFKFPTICH